MSVNLPGHQGRREHHVLRRALACGSTLAAVTALACASATSASAATQSQPARPGPIFLAAHLQSADDVTFPVYDVQLTNGADNLCLDAEDDSGGNPSEAGDKVQLWTCNSGAANQHWVLSMSGDSYDGYSSGVIYSEYSGGLCLSAGGSSGDAVQMGSCSWADREQNTWIPFQNSNGSFGFYNGYTGLYITAEDDSGGNPNYCGDNIQVQDSSGAAAQQWTIDGPTQQCS